MNRKMVKFPEIGQFRQIIKTVHDRTRYAGKDENGDAIYDHSTPLPVLKWSGTIKLHGTNSGVTMTKDGDIYAQSREHIITPDHDNAGFAFFVESHKNIFADMFKTIDMKDADYITIFGEWCGANIQKGVAICNLPKMLVIFAVKLAYEDDTKKSIYLTDDETKHLKSIDNKIYNIMDFENYTIEIDFNNPHLIQNKLIDLTIAVETECPVGKAFGVTGIGEGIVWKCHYNDDVLRFKVKGEKHQSSKVKTLAPVNTEKINSIKELYISGLTQKEIHLKLNIPYSTTRGIIQRLRNKNEIK